MYVRKLCYKTPAIERRTRVLSCPAGPLLHQDLYVLILLHSPSDVTCKHVTGANPRKKKNMQLRLVRCNREKQISVKRRP